MEKQGPRDPFREHGAWEDDDLSFKPLTDGLGFHPFSDGLPYAPVSQNLTRGTGAVAAGRPTFVRPRETPMPPSVPRPTPAQPAASLPSAQIPRVQVPVAEAALKRVQPAPKPSAPIAAAQPVVRFGFGYLLRRVTGFFLDSALNVGVCGGALMLALDGQDIKPDVLFDPGVVLLSILFFIAFNWAVITAQEIAFGSSVGKRLVRLRLQGTVSALFLRSFFFLLSAGFFGFGLLWAIFDRRRRCWHDLIVDLQPVPHPRS